MSPVDIIFRFCFYLVLFSIVKAHTICNVGLHASDFAKMKYMGAPSWFYLPFLWSETTFVTSCLLLWTKNPFQNGVYSKRKESRWANSALLELTLGLKDVEALPIHLDQVILIFGSFFSQSHKEEEPAKVHHLKHPVSYKLWTNSILYEIWNKLNDKIVLLISS